MKILFLPLAFLAATPANAYWGHCSKTSTLTLESVTVLKIESPCQLAQPLVLTRVTHAYPLMGNQSYTVDAWQGSYARTEFVRNNYRRDFYNSCTGEYEYTDFISDAPHDATTSFSVDNPNLHDDVAASYNLAPMTDDEAKAALATAEKNCEQAVPSPIAVFNHAPT